MAENALLTLSQLHTFTQACPREPRWFKWGRGKCCSFTFPTQIYRNKPASLTFRPPLSHVVAGRSDVFYNSDNNSLFNSLSVINTIRSLILYGYLTYPTWLNRTETQTKNVDITASTLIVKLSQESKNKKKKNSNHCFSLKVLPK